MATMTKTQLVKLMAGNSNSPTNRQRLFWRLCPTSPSQKQRRTACLCFPDWAA